MNQLKEHHHAILGGLWLIGLGLLFATGRWWPGIMFIIAITTIVEGCFNGQPWYGVQSGYWAAFIGVWALAGFSFAFLLVGLGISTILGALVKPSPFSKPKPFVDGTLE
jgi:hypothetical protein